MLQKICAKYDNLAEVDKLASVTRKVETVKLVMQENVDLALKNCVKLETIERAAGEGSNEFTSKRGPLNYLDFLPSQRIFKTKPVSLNVTLTS